MTKTRTCLAWSLALALALPALAAAGLSPGPETEVISLAGASLTFRGVSQDDWSGYSISPAGDVNGDGYDDVVVGAPYGGTIEPYGEGTTYLILGRPRDQWPANHMDLTMADASFIGIAERSMTGRQVYTAGDVNGDGYDDFLANCYKCKSWSGRSYLFLGRPTVAWGQNYPVEEADASFFGEGLGDRSGYYTSTAGDVNGDGLDDFLITATGNEEGGGFKAGQVYLILGRASADWGLGFGLGQSDASFIGEVAGDVAGRSAAGVGDVNGDGFADFLIGALFSSYTAEDAGQAYLILGRAVADWGQAYPLAQADASFVGEAAGDQLGRRVARAGDVNGDGYGDFLLGASYNDQAAPDAGKAYLFLGRPAADWGMHHPAAQADASFLGEAAEDQAGRRVSSAGDVNHDGYADWMIDATQSDRGYVDGGATYLLFGRADADWGPDFLLAQADKIYVAEAEADHAGYDVAGLGDFDGDGVDDIGIGAWAGDENGRNSGQTYLLLTDLPPAPVAFTPDAPQGRVAEWHSFVTEYHDGNGWQDLTSLELSIGLFVGDRKGLSVLYDAPANALYLRNNAGTGWLGPCTPGQRLKLVNGVVQLDCGLTTASNDGDEGMTVNWRARWGMPIGSPRVMTAYLRAVDSGGLDSGFMPLGTWTLNP